MPRYMSQFTTSGLLGRPIYKDANYTLLPGDTVFADSNSGPITMTLPASPRNGDYVGVFDSGMAANINTITINRNGINIDSIADDVGIDISGGRWSFVYDLANTTWHGAYETVNNRTGLSQAEVDARVDVKTLGKKRITLRPENELQLPGIDPATAVKLDMAPSGVPSYFMTHSFSSAGSNDYTQYTFIVPPGMDTSIPFQSRLIWTPSNTDTGDIVFNVRSALAPASAAWPVSVYRVSYGPFAAGGAVKTVYYTAWKGIDVPGLTNGDICQLTWYRIGGDVLDTFTGIMYLLAIEFEYTINAATDD